MPDVLSNLSNLRADHRDIALEDLALEASALRADVAALREQRRILLGMVRQLELQTRRQRNQFQQLADEGRRLRKALFELDHERSAA
jgi:hypothetical protein